MKSIRIGNDIRIEWPMVLSGDVEKLSELDLTVEVCPSVPREPMLQQETITVIGNGGCMVMPRRGDIPCPDDWAHGHDHEPCGKPFRFHAVTLPYYIEDNTLIATWTADKQFAIGDYDIRLYSKKNKGGQGVVDQHRFVRLVPHTAMADAPGDSETEAVISLQPLTLELSGLSAYDIAVKHGFTGTEDEWLLSLQGKGDTFTVDLLSYTKKTDFEALEKTVDGKQDKLVSGENIKTINGKSIIGEGDIVIAGGDGTAIDTSEFVKKDNLKTINGESLIGSGNIAIEGESSTFDTDLDDSMETTVSVGNIAKGTLCSELKGKTFTEILEKMLFSEIYPTPNYMHTISLSPMASPVESGTQLTNPTMTAAWNANIRPASTITTALTAKVNGETVDISSGKYTLEGFSTIVYTMKFSYPEGSYEVTSNYGNKKTVTVPAVSSSTKTVSVTSTYPWYINDKKQSTLITLGGTKTVEVSLSGQPCIKAPGAGSTIAVQVDLGFGYMDVAWESGTETINGITYVTLTKPDSYTTASKHKITITVKE